jgi:hypothetical protein
VLIPDDLAVPERRLWDAMETGEPVSLLGGGTPEELDPASGDQWGSERIIRGEALSAMLTARYTATSRVPRAARLSFARITGTLDLEGLDLACPLILESCFFDNSVNANETRAPKLELNRCHIPSFTGKQLQTRGSLALAGTRARSVELGEARIGGHLNLSGAHLNEPGGFALHVGRAQIDGSMHCQGGFQAEGETRLLGAHIGGQLTMVGARLVNPSGVALYADGVKIDGGMFCHQDFQADGEMRLNGARIGGILELSRAHLKNPGGVALRADRTQIDGSVFGMNGFRAEGEIRLLGAHFAGQLNLSGAHLNNPDGIALYGDGTQIDGGLVCQLGFRAEGEMRLLGAHIAQQLNLVGAHLKAPGGIALGLDGARIDGDLRCQNDFLAEGELRLLGTHITGQLSLNGAHLNNPGGIALYADGAQIDRDMFCDHGFEADGLMRLPGAHIGGQLSFIGAHLNNPSGNALHAVGADISEDMLCGPDFKADGALRLQGVHVVRRLDLAGAKLNDPSGVALDLRHATITNLVLPKATAPRGVVDLTHARLTHLEDGWPNTTYGARLGGLSYETLSPLDDQIVERLNWLSEAEGAFRPQPYEQLAAVLRREGHDDDARQVAVAKERARRRTLRWPSKLRSGFLALTVGYGYKPAKGLWWLAGLFALDWLIFAWAKAHGHFRAVREKPEGLPQLHISLYALDHVLPVIELGQRSYWSATGACQYWQTFSDLAGWLLVTVILGAVTARLVRS